MNQQTLLKNWVIYLLIPVIAFIIISSSPGAIIVIGIPQFLIGVIQLLIAFFKTLYGLVVKKTIHKVLLQYWLMVALYFGSYIVVWRIFMAKGEPYIEPQYIFSFYMALPWAIAAFHFDKVLPLKTADKAVDENPGS